MFYRNFVDLCNKKGMSPSAVAEEMGYQRSVVTRWGNGTKPRQATLQKIADYFGVSVDHLVGNQENENPATETGSGIPKDDIDLLKQFHEADETTKAAIRLLLKL